MRRRGLEARHRDQYAAASAAGAAGSAGEGRGHGSLIHGSLRGPLIRGSIAADQGRRDSQGRRGTRGRPNLLKYCQPRSPRLNSRDARLSAVEKRLLI